VVVVHHDVTLDRTTNATGPIAARTAAELASVDAGCRFVPPARAASPVGVVPDGGAWTSGTTAIPTLEEVLRRYPTARVIVEMKVNSAAMGRAVADQVRRSGATARVCAAGFGLQSLQAVREALPELATSASQEETRLALYRSWVRLPVRRAPYGGYQVPEVAGPQRVVSPRFVRHAHDIGLRVQVWTVDDPEDMQRLLVWGVDGLITNRPDLAVRARDAFVARRGTGA
jgi:glycerophosphoryl diester phosphodiesterase